MNKEEVVIIRIESIFFCVSLRYEMSFKLHLILAWKPLVFMQIRCNFPDISYLSETQKNNFQFLSDNLLRFTKMVKCLPEFEYFYSVLEKEKHFFLKLEDQKLQTMQL